MSPTPSTPSSNASAISDLPALAPLLDSAERLRGIVARLDADQLRAPAYPSEWIIAQVLSHLGSGAVISRHVIDELLRGDVADGEVIPSREETWDEWNAKSPEEQADDVIVADARFIARVESISEDDRPKIVVRFGPMELDLATFVSMRLSEHTLHTWDVEVALDPTATLHPTQVDLVIDSLERVGGFSGRSDGASRTLHVRTSDPVRDFAVATTTDSVTVEHVDVSTPTDLELPAESFIRLIYGRLDADHTPSGVESPQLAELRGVFKGF